jgi:D-threonine aldolase
MKPKYDLQNPQSIPSPSLLFFREALEANLTLALGLAGGADRLRPHVKTHKTREICRMQMERGIRRFKATTLAEATMLALEEAPEVLVASPLVGPAVEVLVSLVEAYPATHFQVVCDHPDAAQDLASLSRKRGLRVSVFLDLDVGLHRTGVAPEDARTFGLFLGSLKGLDLEGIHAYDGQNHQADVESRNAAAQICYDTVMELKKDLEDSGLPIANLVLGGTPSFPFYTAKGNVQASPGTCFLQDNGYRTHFPDQPFIPAALLLARIVSINARQNSFTLDLGYKAIASDPQGVRGIFWGDEPEDALPLFQNEEHWVFRASGHGPPPVGTPVLVLPTHICPSVALHQKAWIVDSDGAVNEKWEIAARTRI